MRKTKLFVAGAALVFAASLFFTGCQNGSKDDASEEIDTSTVDTDNTEEALESAAFSLLRSICKLYEDDGENDAGIEALPKDWQTASYVIDEGSVIGSDEATVYSIPVLSFTNALEFFSDMINIPLAEEDLTNGQYVWSYEGLGSLTFKKSTEEDIIATVDLDVEILKNKITKIKFVSSELYEASGSENKYNGIAYFSAGDVIKRKKDNTYWICVRPAGGPLLKDKSYWICLNPIDKNLVKYKTESVTIVNGDKKEKQTWQFAKGLMPIKTAKAAFHTFEALANRGLDSILENENADSAYAALKAKGFDLQLLCDSRHSFCFAYGDYTKDKKRVTSGKKQNASTQYVQPVILGSYSMKENAEIILTKRADDSTVYSVTDMYDTFFAKKKNWNSKSDFDISKFFYVADAETGKFDETSDTTTYIAKNEESINYFLNGKTVKTRPTGNYYSGGENEPGKLPRQITEKHVVILSPELSIKDNKGTKTEAKNPLSKTQYEVIYRAADSSANVFDYWDSVEATERMIDGQFVSWKSENE